MRKYLCLLTVLILMTFSIQAKQLSLDSAKEIALKNNPGYKAQEEGFKSSVWSYKNSIISLFPSGSASASYSQTDSENTGLNSNYAENGSYGVSLSQPIFMGGRLINAALIAKTSKNISKLNLSEKELEILNTTESKFFALIEAKQLLEIANDELTVANQRVIDSNTRFQQGTISKADLLQVQADAANKNVILIQAQLAYDVSYKDLKNYLLITEDFEVIEENEDSFDAEISGLNSLNASAMDVVINRMIDYSNENSNSMKALKLSTSIAKRNVNNAIGSFMPNVNLSYSYNNSGDAREDWSNYPWRSSISLNASIPIFPLVDSYSDVAKAKADLRQTEYQYIDSVNNNSLGVESSLLNLISAARKYQASQLSLEYSEETYKQMQARYDNGLLSGTDLLDSEVMYKSARMNKVSSKFDYLEARSALKKLLGLKDDQDIISMIIE